MGIFRKRKKASTLGGREYTEEDLRAMSAEDFGPLPPALQVAYGEALNVVRAEWAEVPPEEKAEALETYGFNGYAITLVNMHGEYEVEHEDVATVFSRAWTDHLNAEWERAGGGSPKLTIEMLEERARRRGIGDLD